MTNKKHKVINCGIIRSQDKAKMFLLICSLTIKIGGSYEAEKQSREIRTQ